MGTIREVSMNDLAASVREEEETRSSTPAPQNGGASSDLIASIREDRRISQEEELANRAKTRATAAELENLNKEVGVSNARAAIADAEASRVTSEASSVKSDLEIRRGELERRVLIMVEQGVPEEQARRAVGLATAPGTSLVPIGQPTDVFKTFAEGMTSMLTLQAQIQAMAQKQMPQPTGLVPAPQTGLLDKLKELQELRGSLVVMAKEMGMVSQEDLDRLRGAVPVVEKDPLMVNLTDLTSVPASIAIPILESQRSERVAMKEIEAKYAVERRKWDVIAEIKEEFKGLLDFKSIGRALAQQTTTPTPAAQAAASPLIRYECPECKQNAVMFTREMVFAKAKAACSNCGAVVTLAQEADNQPVAEKGTV